MGFRHWPEREREKGSGGTISTSYTDFGEIGFQFSSSFYELVGFCGGVRLSMEEYYNEQQQQKTLTGSALKTSFFLLLFLCPSTLFLLQQKHNVMLLPFFIIHPNPTRVLPPPGRLNSGKTLINFQQR